MAELKVKVVLEHESTQEIKKLKEQQKEITRRIRELTGSKKMDNDFARWKSFDDLKQDFTEQLRNIEWGKTISLKRFMSTPDYYIYAMTKKNKKGGSITIKASSKDATWVQDEIKKNDNESQLIQNANQYRKDEWVRKNKPKRKKKTGDGTLVNHIKNTKNTTASLNVGTSGTGVD